MRHASVLTVGVLLAAHAWDYSKKHIAFRWWAQRFFDDGVAVLCIVLCVCCCKKRGRDGPKMSTAAAAYRPAATSKAPEAPIKVSSMPPPLEGTLPPKGMSSALQVMGDSKTQVTAVI